MILDRVLGVVKMQLEPPEFQIFFGDAAPHLPDSVVPRKLVS